MKIFDYVYYRAFCWYKKKNDTNPTLMGELVVTVLIALMFFSLLTALSLFLFIMPKLEKWHTLLGLLIIYNFVKYRYTKVINGNKLDDLWSYEGELLKKKRGWTMIVTIIIVLVFPILIGYLRHNLGFKI